MDPDVADEPEMALSALRAVDADHILPPSEMAPLITRLAGEVVEAAVIPNDIRLENEVAQRAMLAGETADDNTETLNCPECGGNLERVDPLSYRCRLGHEYG
jgi:hypothetical protein